MRMASSPSGSRATATDVRYFIWPLFLFVAFLTGILIAWPSGAQHWSGPNDEVVQKELQQWLREIRAHRTGVYRFLRPSEQEEFRTRHERWIEEKALKKSPNSRGWAAWQFAELLQEYVEETRRRALISVRSDKKSDQFSCAVLLREDATLNADNVFLMGANNKTYLYSARVVAFYNPYRPLPRIFDTATNREISIREATIGLVIQGHANDLPNVVTPEDGRKAFKAPDPKGCFLEDFQSAP
jgi:hypothetical protein